MGDSSSVSIKETVSGGPSFNRTQPTNNTSVRRFSSRSKSFHMGDVPDRRDVAVLSFMLGLFDKFFVLSRHLEQYP